VTREYVLSELERALLQELNQRGQAAAMPFQQQVYGILTLIARREQLQGAWDLNSEGTKLVQHADHN
jgi:hypothetical protein